MERCSLCWIDVLLLCAPAALSIWGSAFCFCFNTGSVQHINTSFELRSWWTVYSISFPFLSSFCWYYLGCKLSGGGLFNCLCCIRHNGFWLEHHPTKTTPPPPMFFIFHPQLCDLVRTGFSSNSQFVFMGPLSFWGAGGLSLINN